MLPVLGLVVFEFQNYSTVADRYMYLAMLGPAMAVAFLVARWRRPAVTVVLVLIALAGFKTWTQIHVWRDTHTLFGHVMRINPTSLGAHKALAFSLAHEGKPEESLATSTPACARTRATWT